ncbi:MAG: AgmX/PglI C-terminal domain-containing protein [Kofleriaceae bacterium]|nr:AgmX/PglI C-terminal domain-containing protein [Kofleriaceae bacterium]MCB9574350.1 AgmX/PglI C-terminal domain-containing protein [Kofleriaceae bacterium]
MSNAKQRSMAAQAGRRRILRIGVLLGGKIVEERLIRGHDDVTIGQSSKNTFSIPLETLPRQWTIFGNENEGYVLKFLPKMDGRISDGASVYTFEQVKAGRAQNRGDHWVMPLTDQARGKVTMGDLTLLFQFVTEPPVQPRPMLPHSVRGTLAERIDPRLAVICAISIVIHFGIMLAALIHDRPEKRNTLGYQATQSITVDTTFDAPEIPEQPPEDTKAEDGKKEEPGQKEEPKKVDKQPASTPSKKDPGSASGGRSEKDTAALQEDVARYAAALAGDSEADGGITAMSKTAPGGDLKQQLNEVKDSNASVKVGGTGDRGTRGDGEVRTGTGTGPKLENPGEVKTTGGDKTAKEPKGRIQVSGKKSFDDTTLTPDAVLKRIMDVYMAGLKRCQKEMLKTDPTARARVELNFTVNESGRVTGPSAKSDYSGLNSCIKGQMGNWNFPKPKDSDGEATEATFQITLALQPE